MCSCQKRTIFLVVVLALAVGASYTWRGFSGRASSVANARNEALLSAASAASLTVYYFHGTFRCQTCLEIERVSREAVEAFYVEELAGGSVRWRPVNFELPGNEHYFDDFDLRVPSLAVEFRTGDVLRRIVLSNTWKKVEMPGELEDYVITGIEAFRAGAEPRF